MGKQYIYNKVMYNSQFLVATKITFLMLISPVYKFWYFLKVISLCQ